ncbi:hypothetical protein [Paractinoplanes maris]|uniref:hypothetical protein n=1 Tax=Paractinoplanes maris TaxID=1734446 RepID=UPI00202266DB|nr:hypothetical protein [Actinoplanes maris]
MAAAGVVFAYRMGVHVTQLLVGGLEPYPLSAYFVSLTVLDAAVVVLLLRRPAAGLVLGATVLATDALANYVVDRSEAITPGRAGQAVISILTVALIAALPRTLGAIHGRA